jgi:uncharacterized protein (TIGR02598 family)
LALGITAWAILVVMGLFGSGLQNFNQSQNRAATARIAQSLLNELSQSDWGSLYVAPSSGSSTGAPQTFSTRFFDGQGDELTQGSDATKRAQAVYLAKPVLFAPTTEAGFDYSTAGAPEFLRVVVEVMNLPGGQDPASDPVTMLWIPSSLGHLNMLSFTVARTSHS